MMVVYLYTAVVLMKMNCCNEAVSCEEGRRPQKMSLIRLLFFL